MVIFITGASGFIGSHLIPLLVQKGHRLVCLIPEHEAGRKFAHLEAHHQQIQLVQGSILSSPERLQVLMTGCTHLVHLAGLYSFFAPETAYREINEIGTRNVFVAAMHERLRCVHVSTSATFGRQSGFFDEEVGVGEHVSLYAYTKWLGDEHVRDLRREGLSVSILFPACVLGARDPQASGQYLRGIAEKPWLRGGHGLPMLPFQRREMTWVHAEDVAEAILSALTKEVAKNRDYLVGGNVLPFQSINDTASEVQNGTMIHAREYFPFDRLLLYATLVLAPVFRALRVAPPWGFSPDQIRTMLTELRFHGARAREELLHGRYRPIEAAIRDFFRS